MAISIRNPKVEKLARELSRSTGATMTEAIADALEARLQAMGSDRNHRLAELSKITAECAASPDFDTRSPEQILGYDGTGTFKHGN